jgi:hypothetical protein
MTARPETWRGTRAGGPAAAPATASPRRPRLFFPPPHSHDLWAGLDRSHGPTSSFYFCFVSSCHQMSIPRLGPTERLCAAENVMTEDLTPGVWVLLSLNNSPGWFLRYLRPLPTWTSAPSSTGDIFPNGDICIKECIIYISKTIFLNANWLVVVGRSSGILPTRVQNLVLTPFLEFSQYLPVLCVKQSGVPSTTRHQW